MGEGAVMPCDYLVRRVEGKHKVKRVMCGAPSREFVVTGLSLSVTVQRCSEHSDNLAREAERKGWSVKIAPTGAARKVDDGETKPTLP